MVFTFAVRQDIGSVFQDESHALDARLSIILQLVVILIHKNAAENNRVVVEDADFDLHISASIRLQVRSHGHDCRNAGAVGAATWASASGDYAGIDDGHAGIGRQGAKIPLQGQAIRRNLGFDLLAVNSCRPGEIAEAFRQQVNHLGGAQRLAHLVVHLDLIAQRIAHVNFVSADLLVDGEDIMPANSCHYLVGQTHRLGLIADDAEDVRYFCAILRTGRDVSAETDAADKAGRYFKDMPDYFVDRSIVMAGNGDGLATAPTVIDNAVGDVLHIGQVLAEFVTNNRVEDWARAVVAKDVHVGNGGADGDDPRRFLGFDEGIPEVARRHDAQDSVGGEIALAGIKRRLGAQGDAIALAIIVAVGLIGLKGVFRNNHSHRNSPAGAWC